jgi:hypothetical protein
MHYLSPFFLLANSEGAELISLPCLTGNYPFSTHAFGIIMHHSQTRTNQPLTQSTIFPAICARSHFQLLAVAAEKKFAYACSFCGRTLQKMKNTAQAPACYYLVSNIHSGSGGGAAPAADETDVQRVHEGGGTQYRFSSSDSPGKCVCFRKHTRTCLSLRLHLVFCLSLFHSVRR